MAVTEIQGILVDDAMSDGYVELHSEAPGCFGYRMSPATYYSVAGAGLLADVFDALGTLGAGTHLIPRRCLEPEAAEDLERVLEYAEPGGAGCTMPGCLQDVTSLERGFPLCELHASLLADIDSLVA